MQRCPSALHGRHQSVALVPTLKGLRAEATTRDRRAKSYIFLPEQEASPEQVGGPPKQNIWQNYLMKSAWADAGESTVF